MSRDSIRPLTRGFYPDCLFILELGIGLRILEIVEFVISVLSLINQTEGEVQPTDQYLMDLIQRSLT